MRTILVDYLCSVQKKIDYEYNENPAYYTDLRFLFMRK